MRVTIVNVTVLGACLVWAACSSGGDASKERPSVATDSGASAEAGDDAGGTGSEAGPNDASADSATTDGPAIDGGPSVRGGGVTLTQSNTSSVYSYAAAASFTEGGSASQQGGCVIEEVGACTVTTCDLAFVPDAGVGPAEKILNSAGAVTISGGKLVAPIVMNPMPSNAYPPANGFVQAFAAGESLRFQAAGATVPAFDQTVTAPAAIAVSAVPAAFARDVDLTVSFTGGGAGDEVLVAVVTQKTGVKGVTLSCTGPASAGTLVVPSPLLQKSERAGQNGFTGVITVGSRRQNVLAAGAHTIILNVVDNGLLGFFTNSN